MLHLIAASSLLRYHLNVSEAVFSPNKIELCFFHTKKPSLPSICLATRTARSRGQGEDNSLYSMTGFGLVWICHFAHKLLLDESRLRNILHFRQKLNWVYAQIIIIFGVIRSSPIIALLQECLWKHAALGLGIMVPEGCIMLPVGHKPKCNKSGRDCSNGPVWPPGGSPIKSVLREDARIHPPGGWIPFLWERFWQEDK